MREHGRRLQVRETEHMHASAIGSICATLPLIRPWGSARGCSAPHGSSLGSSPCEIDPTTIRVVGVHESRAIASLVLVSSVGEAQGAPLLAANVPHLDRTIRGPFSPPLGGSGSCRRRVFVSCLVGALAASADIVLSDRDRDGKSLSPGRDGRCPRAPRVRSAGAPPGYRCAACFR